MRRPTAIIQCRRVLRPRSHCIAQAATLTRRPRWCQKNCRLPSPLVNLPPSHQLLADQTAIRVPLAFHERVLIPFFDRPLCISLHPVPAHAQRSQPRHSPNAGSRFADSGWPGTPTTTRFAFLVADPPRPFRGSAGPAAGDTGYDAAADAASTRRGRWARGDKPPSAASAATAAASALTHDATLPWVAIYRRSAPSATSSPLSERGSDVSDEAEGDGWGEEEQHSRFYVAASIFTLKCRL